MSFLIFNSKNSSVLTVLLSYYFPWKSGSRMLEFITSWDEHFYSLLVSVPVLCRQPPCAELFPPREYLQISGRQDFTSALGTDNEQSVSNFPNLSKSARFFSY